MLAAGVECSWALGTDRSPGAASRQAVSQQPLGKCFPFFNGTFVHSQGGQCPARSGTLLSKEGSWCPGPWGPGHRNSLGCRNSSGRRNSSGPLPVHPCRCHPSRSHVP